MYNFTVIHNRKLSRSLTVTSKGLPCAGKKSSPSPGRDPSCVLLLVRFLACVVVSPGVCALLTLKAERRFALRSLRLAHARFLASAYLCHFSCCRSIYEAIEESHSSRCSSAPGILLHIYQHLTAVPFTYWGVFSLPVPSC